MTTSSSNVVSPFLQSTQRLHWVFPSKEKMQEERMKAFEKIQKEILDLQEKEKDKKLTLDDILTPEEELLIVQKYCSLLLEICARIAFPLHVKATALTYLKRFYFKHSVMEYDISNMVLTCIFLATKTEEKYMALSQFLEKVNEIAESKNLSNAIIFKNELVLLQGLNCELMVYHPYRSLYAYAHDLHEMIGDLADEVYDGAQKTITEILKSTEAMFLYSPSVIALASLYMFNPDIAKTFMANKFKGSEVQIIQQSEEIKLLLDAPLEKPKLKAAEKKLKKTRKILDVQIKNLEEQIIKQYEEERRQKREQKYQDRDKKSLLEQQNLLARKN